VVITVDTPSVLILPIDTSEVVDEEVEEVVAEVEVRLDCAARQ
jgi:hypothetical protein